MRTTLEYTLNNSPFYKKLFTKIQINPSDIGGIEDFYKIPFTSKADIQLNNYDFVCVNRDKIIDHSSTSGTLGKPVHIFLTENDLQRLAHNEARGLRIAGVNEKDRIQLTTTMDKRFMAGLAYFLGVRKIGAGIIRNGSGLPGMQWDTILNLKPSVLIIVPSFLNKLIEYAIENKIDPEKSTVKKAICIGESIRNADGSLNQLGKKISDNWPIKLISTYASTEMQTCFTECEHGNGGHLLGELVYAEIIDDNGNPCKKGETGELVITTLGLEGMPLLRYKTGDKCALKYGKCTCGRNSPRISQISGRKQQMLKVKGTTLYPGTIFNLLDEMNFIDSYIVEATNNLTFGDEITINLCFKPKQDTPDNKDILAEKIQSALRIKITTRVVSKLKIEKMMWPKGARKPVKFIDYRPAG
ncbi:MAG: AMP-binding protein [Flavobacteriales bacterium]|nr:AMP-binding protein [Flavobacteriales bacterium]